MEAFGQILPQVVEVAAQQYLKHAKAYPPVTGGGHGERTRLTGPMGHTSYTPDPHDPATEAEDL